MKRKYRVYEYWKTGVNGKIENQYMNEPNINKNVYRNNPFSSPSDKPKGSFKDILLGCYLMSCAGYCTFNIIKFVFLKLIS